MNDFSSTKTSELEIRDEKIGPPETNFENFLLQLLGGLGGGIFGTLLMLVIFLLGSSILKPVLTIEGGVSVHPLFIFLFIAMIFIGSLSSNCLSILLISISNKAAYQRISSAIFQTFFINLIIFIFLFPVYIIVSNLNIGSIAYIAALQIILSSFGSFLIMKIIAAHRYALLGVYSSIFAILLSVGILLFIFRVSAKDLTMLLFVTLPIIWLSFGLFEGIVSIIYRFIFTLYGVDFLRSDIAYGKDYGSIQEEVSALSEEERESLYFEGQDEDKGADFLRRKSQKK